MAVSPATLSLNRVAEKARQLFSPVVNTYNQVNTAYQRVNNPPVRQMYNQLPQRLEPVRRTYNTVNQGLQQASAYRRAVPLQQRIQLARQDMRANPIKYSLPGQIAQLPSRPAQMFGKAYEGTLEGLSAGLIDVPARPSQNNFERGAYVAGNLLGMFNPASPLMRGGQLISKAPLITQTQRPLGRLAGRLIAQGGGKKIAGKAIANISQGIPYTAAYMAGKQALSPLTGQGYTKGDLATDVGFDAAIGAGAGLLGMGAPLAMGMVKYTKHADAGNVARFVKPVRRGDITKLQRNLDDILGTDTYINSGKWQARLPARETARRNIEAYADQGDEAAQRVMKEVERIENEIADLQITRQKQKTTPPKLKVKPPTDPLEALKQEARKYKSAEEFVKAQGQPVYHGTTRDFDVFDKTKLGEATRARSAKEGFWFTDDVSTAKSYALAENWRKVQDLIDAGDTKAAQALEDAIFADKAPSRIVDAFVKLKKPLTIDAEGRTYGDFAEEIEQAIVRAKQEGNDGIVFKNLSDTGDYSDYRPATHYLIFDESNLKTKSQLTDLYNQATQPLTKGKIDRNIGASQQPFGELPKNLKVTDAYGKEYLGFNIKGMEEVANKKGYNLYKALVDKVDSQISVDKKVAGLQSILNDLSTKGKIESIKHPTGLSLGDVEQVNGLLKNKGVVIEGSGTKTATIKVPKQLMESLGINKNGFTLKGDYYEIQRPGALFNIHSDKTTLAQAIQKAESNVAQPTQPPKGKIEANQTVIGKTQISPQTKLETPQPLPNVANASPGLMTQAPPKKQLVQLKKQPGKLLSNDQEKVQPQALDNIIAEGRRSIGSAKQEPGRPVKQVLNDLYTQWVDRYHPLSRASKQAKNTLRVKGAELRPEYDPDYLVRRLTGAGGIADQRFNTELKPIIDEVDQLGIPKLDMDTYLAHKRMAGFGDVDREIIGADPIKSKQITTALEAKYPQISGVADKLYKYQDQGLQELVNAGFISPDAVKTIRSQNPDYAPLYRVMDEMDEYLGLPTRKTMQGKNPVVKIKGSKRQIESPVESIIGNTFRQRAAIEKNRVAQSIIGLNKVADMGFNKVAKSGNDTITVWNNGVKEYWQVGTDIADVAKGVNEEVTNTLLKIIQAPAQLLRQGATGRNPAFMIPNVVRDQLDAGITSKYGYIPFVDYVSGLKSMVKNDAIYQKWQNSGAKIDLGELSGKKSVAKLFDEKRSKKRLYQWITEGLDVMGKYSEQPTRVGLFKKAYNKTGNELLGAMESRDATVDFARMGSKMKVANSIIPFLNVGVQGFDKLVRATRNNPKKVLLNMGIYGATPAIAITAYNLQNFPREYEEIPQYEKDTNFVIVKGRNAEGVVDYLTIPKGNIVPVVANPIQSFTEYLAGVDGKSFSELAVNLVSETLPVLEGGDTPREVLVKTSGSMIPQFAKPIIEDITNKSFFKYDAKKEAQGKESGVIVPSYLKKKEPYQQTYEFTPQMYQKIGAVLNVSPLRVKNMMEGYLAGYAKIPVQITEMMNAVSKGEPISPNDKTVLSRFVKQTYPSSSTQKPVETKDTPGLMDRITGKVSADTGTTIPTDQDTFNELYKKALSNGTDFPRQKALIEADPTLDEAKKAEKIEKLRTETAQWAETLITMQEKYPKQVFGAELKTYSGNTYKVPERAEWVAKQLNKATTPEEMRDMLDQMWDAGVLTTGKTGTAQALIDMGINVYAIGNKVGTKSKKAKSSGTKVKKPKKISFTSIKVPKVKLTKVKTFKPPKAKKLRIKKMRKYKIRSMA